MTEMIVREEQSLMPAMTMDQAANRYNALVEYTQTLMKKGKDYGVIPGTGDKPTLLKPGAEKLCSLFGLFPDFETIEKIVDFDKGLFYFRVKCTLSRNGVPVASGIGSCNSKEKKYRYRYVYENKATEQEKANAVSVEEKTGKYGAYKVYKVENSEPFELVNTIDKMAQKRALVAATLIGANASEFYTQDVEDMGFIEGNFEDVHIEDEPKPQPAQPAKKAAGKFARPMTPEILREALAQKAIGIGTYEASDKQRNFLGSLLNEHFQDDAKRHEASEWLFGNASTKDIDGALVKAALDWLKPEKDDGGAYVIDKDAQAELSSVLTVALQAAGQEALL